LVRRGLQFFIREVMAAKASFFFFLVF